MRIVIFGGHGRVARLLAPLLVSAGHRVESVVRDPAHIDEIEATGAAARVADLERLDTAALTDMIRECDAVIWSAGAGGDASRTMAVDRDAAIRSIDAAVAASVPRYVMVSYTKSGRDQVEPDHPFGPFATAKADADAHLRGSRLNWTILGPGVLTDGPGTGMVEVGDHVTSGDTSRANVARVALQVVGHTDLDGVTLNFRDGRTPIAEVLQVTSVMS